jgi:5-methylcytosine-specific restriction protein A
MPVRPQPFRSRSQPTALAVDRDRGSSRERGYDSRWDAASRAFRRAHPLCQYCEAGAFGPVRVSASVLTDHLYPHRRFEGVFWRTEWWVAACTECHSGPKQQAEVQGLTALHRLATLLARPPWQGGG